MTSEHGWEFWIDVGGTFTDCIGVAPDGELRTHKLLSSGFYRGRVGPGSTRTTIIDAGRCVDPAGFFDGWQLRLRGDLTTRVVRQFDPLRGELHLADETRTPTAGEPYELTCGQEAPLVGIRWLRGLRCNDPFGKCRVRLGTTRGTNALLERQGARTALVTTRGFVDVLRIGTQQRPRLFDLNVRLPTPLYEVVVEIDERLGAAGEVLLPLGVAQAERELRLLQARGIESLAICLLHSVRNPEHERRLAEIAGRMGFRSITQSAQLSPRTRIVPRGQTTVLNAYLAPIVNDYVQTLSAGLPQAELHLMSSAGALARPADFQARDALLSGPAGGAVGVAAAARAAGFTRAIGFDMGGTSTDICRWDGEIERRQEIDLEDKDTGALTRLVAPQLAIETVAAGGGSICGFDGLKPIVGPRSAGAAPGPACYGAGGPLTITDVNLLLGRIVPEHFPFPLDRAAAERRIDELIEQIAAAAGKRYERVTLAEGYLEIANARMAAAIRKVSIQRGYDPREYVLVAFGGAAGQHACAVADELGMTTILHHPLASLMSAYGIGQALQARRCERELHLPLAEFLPSQSETFDALETEARAGLDASGVPADCQAAPRRELEMRYKGQDEPLTICKPPAGDWAAAFAAQHRQLHGFTLDLQPIEVVVARVEIGQIATRARPLTAKNAVAPTIAGARSTYLNARWQSVRSLPRGALTLGVVVSGPMLIDDPTSTIVLLPGWTAEQRETGEIILRRVSTECATPAIVDEEDCDPVQLELFAHRFMAIADEMGALLQRSALSTNVRERLDFSCAMFDAAGELVANAAHIPVHLGAMGACVQELRAAAQRDPQAFPLQAGDAYVTNDPYAGGSHLPDVTLVTPVHVGESAAPAFYVASRAHHAEIGGIAPGSMPADSQRLGDEGVLIPLTRIARFDSEPELRKLFEAGPRPSRSASENVADLRAQAAANHRGAHRLVELAQEHSLPRVQRYMRFLQDAASDRLAAALRKLPAGISRFEDRLDDGSPLVVTIARAAEDAELSHEDTKTRRNVFDPSRLRPPPRVRIDFTGTGSTLGGNLNATPAIVSSAVIYCLRCLIGADLPLNAGLLRGVELVLPRCFLNPPVAGVKPESRPAVAGGNVETSQRIVDCLLGAFGAAAASQGTMNNFSFGDGTFGYYETICGGAGAGPGFHGASAVHTHMTNTRLTDPEVLEARYPVRLRRFEIRRSSGGAGQFTGGDGVIREIEFLKPLQVSLLTQRRRFAPYGLQGGMHGLVGRNRLLPAGRPDWEELGWRVQFEVDDGDILRIETPGGGGYGPACV